MWISLRQNGTGETLGVFEQLIVIVPRNVREFIYRLFTQDALSKCDHLFR